MEGEVRRPVGAGTDPGQALAQLDLDRPGGHVQHPHRGALLGQPPRRADRGMPREGEFHRRGVDPQPRDLGDRIGHDHRLAEAGARRQRLVVGLGHIARAGDAQRIAQPSAGIGEHANDLDPGGVGFRFTVCAHVREPTGPDRRGNRSAICPGTGDARRPAPSGERAFAEDGTGRERIRPPRPRVPRWTAPPGRHRPRSRPRAAIRRSPRATRPPRGACARAPRGSGRSR
ncbi:Uncharacterised protein [Mycobacteroides abscessus subsp. abscessus]|nr:Uncharacterised protein [Mycobacteroides abscessus subsp. abscessus]